jgi:hypothetical protein
MARFGGPPPQPPPSPQRGTAEQFSLNSYTSEAGIDEGQGETREEVREEREVREEMREEMGYTPRVPSLRSEITYWEESPSYHAAYWARPTEQASMQ